MSTKTHEELRREVMEEVLRALTPKAWNGWGSGYCDTCGWIGSMHSCVGRDGESPPSDYDDLLCPRCSDTLEELDEGTLLAARTTIRQTLAPKEDEWTAELLKPKA